MKESSEGLLYEIIEIRDRKGEFGRRPEDREVTNRFFVHWINGDELTILPKDFEEKDMLEIARYTLAEVLQSHISGGINLEAGDIVKKPSLKGFKITEQKYTKYLLAAIYYDLWQTINNDKHVYLCENKNCGLPFVKSGRKRYCNEACKQEAYRIRVMTKD